MELGKKIRQLRFKAGLTQEQLADELGISPQAVSKWENAAAMPDISALPLLAEVFGVSIDDLFDLTAEQRFKRIEHRLDIEDALPQDVFLEYEEFLTAKTAEEPYKKRATELLAYLYWHRMEMFAEKARRFARQAVRAAPGEKGCQWILQKAEGHAAWDWNIANHTAAVDFYRELSAQHPEERLPYMYLLDNLIADHRTAEAEVCLSRLASCRGVDPVLLAVYRAHIALARFDEKTSDGIIEALVAAHPEESVGLFEAAQYYAGKAAYDRAIELYERSFEREPRRPRFTDELQGILDICTIQGEYQKAADTCDRILALLQAEWGITEGDELRRYREKKAALLAKI